MKLKLSIGLYATLIVSYILIRVVFFDLHGMIQFTDTLILVDSALTAVFILRNNSFSATLITLAYPLGFVLAYLFQTTNGSFNNLWIIWLVVELIMFVLSMAINMFHVKHYFPKSNKLI